MFSQDDINHLGVKLLEYELNLGRMIRQNDALVRERDELAKRLEKYEPRVTGGGDAPAVSPAQEAQNG